VSADAGRPLAFGAALVRLHDRFRGDLTGIREDVEHVLAGDRAAVRARDLETHCLAFCSRLHEHHGEEDALLFPHLAREHPELEDVLRRLGHEHREVARGLDALRGALSRFADTEDPAAARGLLEEVVHLSRALEAHLDREEAHLVPVLDRLTSLPEGM
jgi:iron-sulfur cluster repair protein YtfE (RIC family)